MLETTIEVRRGVVGIGWDWSAKLWRREGDSVMPVDRTGGWRLFKGPAYDDARAAARNLHLAHLLSPKLNRLFVLPEPEVVDVRATEQLARQAQERDVPRP